MSGRPEPQTDAIATILAAEGQPEVLAVIWATVDTERVLAEVGLPGVELPDDPQLGASVKLVRPPDGQPIALLEPRTEGRIAATLARAGEGPAGRYVVASDGLASVKLRAATEEQSLSPEYDGPFGRSVLVTDGPATGPHVVLVERPAGTIDR
jgi:hypothetical protein